VKRLICTAAPFGYGPVAKLLTICKFLTNYQLEFVGTGPALELARHASYFSTITKADYDLSANRQLFQPILSGADLLLASVEPAAIELARTFQVPCCYVDSLFWMWDTLPEACYEVTCYCAQRFPGVSERQATFGRSVRNLRLVGPIVDRTFRRTGKRDPFLLVSLGGLESPLVREHESLLYAGPVISALDQALRRSQWSEVIVTGNHAVMVHLQEHYGRPGLTFTHLAHEDFLKLMARAAFLLTSPGLTTTYEALVYQVPMRFLPPQNYSQALMLKLYRSNGLADRALDWCDLYPQALITEGLPEEEGVRQVQASIQRFAADLAAQEVAVSVFQEMLTYSLPDSSMQASRLGIPLTDGAQEVATIIINELLSKTNEHET
jgi:hydroxymethylcytosylglucuronate/cytosylglucuronate synthase